MGGHLRDDDAGDHGPGQQQGTPKTTRQQYPACGREQCDHRQHDRAEHSGESRQDSGGKVRPVTDEPFPHGLVKGCNSVVLKHFPESQDKRCGPGQCQPKRHSIKDQVSAGREPVSVTQPEMSLPALP